MKFLTFLTVLILSAAHAETNRPTRCLYQAKGGITQSLPCNQIKPSNPGVQNGVCLFDSGAWKRGSWSPKKVGANRFAPGRICDQGIEFVTERDNEIASPKLFGSSLVVEDKKTNTFESSMPAPDFKVYPSQIPLGCYIGQNKISGKSNEAHACGSLRERNFCYPRNFTGEKISGRILKGWWWIMRPNPAQTNYKVCWGGVTMKTPEPGDYSWKQAPATTRTAEGEVVLTCKPENTALKALDCRPALCNKPGKDGIGCCRLVKYSTGVTWAYQSVAINQTGIDKYNAAVGLESLTDTDTALNVINTHYGSAPNWVNRHIKCKDVNIRKLYKEDVSNQPEAE